MGTSFSQRSPGTVNWAAVRLGYRRDEVPEERVVQELWRAAQSDPAADWGRLLASPIVASCLDIATRSNSPIQAVREVTREVVRTRQSSIAADIAKRAVARSFASADRQAGYLKALFGEATNYLVSRDLAGYVGTNGRNRTVPEGLAFKERLRERVEGAVGRLGAPPDRSVDAWNTFVAAAVRELSGQGG